MISESFSPKYSPNPYPRPRVPTGHLPLPGLKSVYSGSFSLKDQYQHSLGLIPHSTAQFKLAENPKGSCIYIRTFQVAGNYREILDDLFERANDNRFLLAKQLA